MPDREVPAAWRAAGAFVPALCWDLAPHPWRSSLAVVGAAAWALALVARRATPRRAALSLLAGASLAAAGPSLLERPLHVLLVIAAGFWWCFRAQRPAELTASAASRAQDARAAAGAVAAAATAVAVEGRAGEPAWLLATAGAVAVVTWLALRGAPGGWRSLRGAGVVAAAVAAVALSSLAAAETRALVVALGTLPVWALVRVPDEPPSPFVAWLLDHPARLVVGTFAALCALGSVVLSLPASAQGAPVSVFDAAFTAVSAVCVTGLTVADTPTAFGPFGEAALLVLIQTGGLGIMTFYSLALRALGRRMGLRHELTVAGAVGVEQESRLFGALGRVLVVTFSIEAVGAALLFVAFLREEATGAALWRAVFTSVSAFCNAGFALQSDNLVSYQRDPAVLHTIAALIVAGGLSPIAITALADRARGRGVSVQVRLVWWATLVLLAIGFVGFVAFEWGGVLAPLGVADRLHNAWFQSVTLRTAGFNSVDLERTAPVTRALMIVLMFIGGSPGSTAGGVKTTTVAVIALTVAAAARGESSVRALGRTFPHTAVYRAIAVATAGVGAVTTAFAALLLTQAIAFDRAAFEVVSALGTVGLTLGVTPQLDPVGRAVIMACMFVGRVGPLTLFLFLADRRAVSEWKYPEEDVAVG
ncbi:MAG: potassium transporter TrkH [Polyangiaceae bacterium]|nr:potassium transporter TrkH [Polyangiaceae bacterium]